MDNINRITTPVLSKTYKEADFYRELVFCSNNLINTNYIFSSDEDWHPLVICKGKRPRVWLSLRKSISVESQEKFEYIDLIVDSELKDLSFSFINTIYGFQVKLAETIIIEAGNHKDDSLEVYKIDFRPLGLNIYGDHSRLIVGNNEMSMNTTTDSTSMFGI